MRKCLFIGLVLTLVACKSNSPVEKVEKNEAEIVRNESLIGVKDSAYRNENLLVDKISEDEKVFENGIKIKWFEHGSGEQIKKEHAYQIEYEVLLEDGTVVDGSKLINRQWVHFLVGFEVQTKGWDFALTKMKIGDFAEIYIPSQLARGKEGITGLIPADAANILRIKILGEIKPDRVVDGTKVWVLAESQKYSDQKAHEDSEVIYEYVVSTPTNPRYVNSRYKEAPYTFRFTDFGIVKGLKKALLGVKKLDKLWIVVPEDQAYGKKGYLNIVKPGESVFYDLFIKEVHDVKE